MVERVHFVRRNIQTHAEVLLGLLLPLRLRLETALYSRSASHNWDRLVACCVRSVLYICKHHTITYTNTVSSENQHAQPALQQGCCVTVWQHWIGGNQFCSSSADGWVAKQASAFSLLPSDFIRAGGVGRLYLRNFLELAHYFDGGINVFFPDSFHGLDVEICCVL